uniref:Ig-like domain-containing protein n=1 Tax=Panagrolaimus sp. PS1159 TaxID=55785 RepID=A0AC35FJY9_9BILA
MRIFFVETFAVFCILFGSCQGWSIQLSPNPESGAVGQRPTGSPVAIMCTISGLGEEIRPEITWSKSNGDYNKTGNVFVRSLDPFTASLVVQNGSLDDNGVYVCTGKYNNEEKQVIIDINFFEELHFKDVLTEIDSPVEGAAVNLSCEVKPTYQAELVTMWEKGIVALTPKSERNYTFFENGQILQINDYLNAQDEGTYNCKVFDRKTGSMISKQIKIGRLVQKRQNFCMHLCTNLCHSLYIKPHETSARRV